MAAWHRIQLKLMVIMRMLKGSRFESHLDIVADVVGVAHGGLAQDIRGSTLNRLHHSLQEIKARVRFIYKFTIRGHRRRIYTEEKEKVVDAV